MSLLTNGPGSATDHGPVNEVADPASVRYRWPLSESADHGSVFRSALEHRGRRLIESTARQIG